MEQTIKWVKGDRPEKEGWYLVYGKTIKKGQVSWCITESRFDKFYWMGEYDAKPDWRKYVDSMIIEYHAEIIGPNGEKYE